MNNEPSAAPHEPPPSAPTPVSAAALVGGVDPRARPPAPPPAGPGWAAPLSMSWHPGPGDAELAPEEMGITWGPTSQSLAVGTRTYVHEGAPTMFSSAGIVRLLLAASAPNTPWQPAGEGDDVRRAEFNAAIVEMLLDMVLISSIEGMPPEMIAPQIAQASEWLLSAPSMRPYPSTARDAVTQLLTDIDGPTLVRLSPIFFERRKIDRDGADPSASVSFVFRSTQVFEGGSDALQAQLATQIVALRALAMAPKALTDLTTDELVLRAFGQPNEGVATAAREEMIARMHRAEGMGGVPTSTMMAQLSQMMTLVSSLYYLVKPSCRICQLPATHVLQQSEHQRDYRCDSHPIAPPQSNAARDLQGAPMIRAAAFVARQAIPAGQGPGAPMPEPPH
jgi:hypothetical protein